MNAGLPDSLEPFLYRVENEAGDVKGIAFAIGPRGLLVTCTHVLDNACTRSAECRLVRFATGEVFNVTVPENLSWPADAEDVTFLLVSGPQAGDLPHLALSPHLPARGAELYSYGFPESRDHGGMPGQCRVVGPAREAGQPLIAISSDEISVGFSGAPAFDYESGLVVGMVTSIAIPDRFGRNAKAAFLTPATTLARLNPKVAIGVDVRIRHYRELMRSRARSPSYFIEGITGSGRLAFVPPALRELGRDAEGNQESRPISLDQLSHGYADGPVAPVCLIGDAGSGKSAVLRAVTERLADGTTALPILVRATALAQARGRDLSETLYEALRASGTFGVEMRLDGNFFSNWSKDLGQRFVLLVDGCDEIADLQLRNIFLTAVKEELAGLLQSRGHSLVIASREVSELQILARDFRRIVVDPLPEESIELMALTVLGPRSADFLAYLGRFANRTLLSSPLVLQLLLALFPGEMEELSSVADIYRAYVEKLKEEWRRRGLRQASDAAAHVLDVLAILAWWDFHDPGNLKAGKTAAADFVARQLVLGPVGASEAVNELVEFLAMEGGIVRVEQRSLVWVHANFRDFFAANALCRLGGASPLLAEDIARTDLCRVVLDNWDSPSAETFARFVLSMSSQTDETSEIAEQLLKHETAGLCFLSRVLGDGTKIPEKTVKVLAKKLKEQAVKADPCALVFTHVNQDPVVALHNLVWREPFFSLAIDLLRECEGDLNEAGMRFRRELAQAARRVCSSDQLDRLKSDDSLPSSIRDIFLESRSNAAE
jgi:hypothetical protein